MANVPIPSRINVPAWTALMRKFRGDDDAASEFAKALSSEMNQLPTHADLRALELRLVRWMIALSALIVGAMTAIIKLT
jgi:hypothetical protein